MDISQHGIEQIVEFEGKTEGRLPDGRYKAYLDTIAKPPVWTIYCGLTHGVHKNMIITEEQGEQMYAAELAVYEDAIEKSTKVPLNQNEFDSAVSFTYNCGVGAYKKSIAPLLNSGKKDRVPAMMMRYIHCGGKVVNGLVNRRRAEVAWFLSPVPNPVVIPPSDPDVPREPMPQRVEMATTSTAKAAVEAAKESTSLWSGLTVFLSTIWMYFNDLWGWLFATAKEAGTEAVAAKDSVSGLEPMLTYFGMNMKAIVVSITIAATIAIIVRAVARRK